MISQLSGIIIEKVPPHLVLDVCGVGYEVAVPMTTFYHLPPCQETVTLYTHLIIRDDAHTLYGFSVKRDRLLFQAIIKVKGIGPKLALTILSGVEPKDFLFYVAQQDVNQLSHIPGIGRKTAERLIIETKDHLARLSECFQDDVASAEIENSQMNGQLKEEAISALLTLGYKPKEAERAIALVYPMDGNVAVTSETLIRLALKNRLVKVA